MKYLLRRELWVMFFLILTVSTFCQIGQVQHHQLYGKSLAGNSIGDPPTRSVSVYLPPSYQSGDQNLFPVVYFLHGYTDSNHKWFGQDDHWIDLPAILDSAFAGISQEFIVVMPNAHNTFKGSMYTNSSTTGLWEDFISQDLVGFIDSLYRTIDRPAMRGLAGHSMGGYGTIKIGMANPDVFGSLYLMSPCCLANNVPSNEGLLKNLLKVSSKEQLEDQPFFVSASLAGAAAWAPNPNKPPLYLDLPQIGVDDPELLARYQTHEIIPNLGDSKENLESMRGIALDVGQQDFMIKLGAESLHQEFEKLSLDHEFEIYEGDHVNRIAERIGAKVVPFFSRIFDQ